MRLDPSFKQEPQKVHYEHNYVTFDSTVDQQAKLKFKLQATGLAVDVKPFESDELPIRKDKHSPPMDMAVELSRVDTDRTQTDDPVQFDFPLSSASVQGTEV